jgi:two-component system, LytTR family, sensor histidine kinase AlgZ
MTTPANPADTLRPAGAASGWPVSTRPAELRSTGFGVTAFDQPALPDTPRPASVFDVCHVGVVLRALLFVHGVVGIGMVFQATSWRAWLEAFALGSGVAMPGVMLWLLVACALKRPLGALPLAAQWSAALLLGAAGGLVGSALGLQLDLGNAGAASRDATWLGATLAGMALAAMLFQWLRLRAQAMLPAATTARLAELQSRIRPHFLFNTLNTALALVRLDPARAEGVLEDLAELFRVALSDSGEAATLADEVALAQRYLDIEQIRFGKRLQLVWEIDPEAAAARVPPLLLQPLVENAVRHGVEPADGGGTIRIRTRLKRGRAVITIVNTVPAAPSRPGNGIALKNVRERLRLMHDVAAQFDTHAGADFFRVQIVVPM